MSLRPEIESHYRQTKEAERLSSGRGELERLRTQAILARRLPPPPATIFDVGGAAGVYAFPLAKQGYELHLIDPVELHLDQAKAFARSSGIALKSIKLGDARRLDIAPGCADAVLLLGPLYHLVEQSDRLQALREAHRILKPGGVLFAAAISRFASLIDGLASGFFQDPEFPKSLLPILNPVSIGIRRTIPFTSQRLIFTVPKTWLMRFAAPNLRMSKLLPLKVRHGVQLNFFRHGMIPHCDKT
jgi:SAM-dependent methyltransferase